MSSEVASYTLRAIINQMISNNDRAKELQRKAIEFNKQEEFDGYKWCDDDCYMCNDQGRCEKSVKKEGNVNG